MSSEPYPSPEVTNNRDLPGLETRWEGFLKNRGFFDSGSKKVGPRSRRRDLSQGSRDVKKKPLFFPLVLLWKRFQIGLDEETRRGGESGGGWSFEATVSKVLRVAGSELSLSDL